MVLECSGFGGGMIMTEDIRYIRKDELRALLELYKYLNKDDLELEENEKLSALWESILNNPSQHYLVAEAGRWKDCILLCTCGY